MTGLISLLLGLTSNQINPRGIPWRLLWTQIHSGAISEKDWLDINEAFMLSLKEPVEFLDIRSESEFNLDHIPHAVSMPWLRLVRNPDALDTLALDRTYILYTFHSESAPCKTVAALMKNNGFEQIFILKDGFAQWLDIGLPVELGVDG